MISRFSVRLRQLRRKIGRSHLAVRLMGLKMPEGEAGVPGLIMLQIDGLSRKQMERALDEGNMPFLSDLIRRRHFETETFYSGMPSTTPAVQAEIFYQVRHAVPAFEFYHPQLGRIARMYEADVAATVEADLRERGSEPLLDGGHSYSNIYRAGAAFSRYCSQDLAPHTLIERLHPLKSLVLGLAYAPKFLRLAALTLIETGLAFFDLAQGLYPRKDFFKEFEFILSRVAVSIGLRELIRFRTLLDIECGIHLIHANFLGYDEQAHRRGPNSAFAHWTLKGIDRTIRDIQRAAHRSPYRDYELVIYSDHGQEATVPFEKYCGKPLEEAVADALADGPLADLRVHRPNNLELFARSLGSKRAPAAPDDPALPQGQTENGERIILSAMGPTGQVYFPRKLSGKELEHAAESLVQKGGIPLIWMPDDDGGALAFNSGGRWRLPEDRVHVFGEDHPFLDEVAADIVTFCRSPLVGDLTLAGWEPGHPPLSFRNENGSHGGPGGEETRGFLLLPDRIRRWHLAHLPRTSKRVRGEDLYSIARHFLHRAGSDAERVPERRPDPEPEPGPLKLRVMTYNIQSCRGLDGKVRPERVVRVINEFDPDVVAIQEVDSHRPRSGHQDQPGKIAEHLRMEHAFHAMLEQEDECYGIAIFSRFPFEIVRSDLLTPARSRREARGAIWLRILPEGKPPFHFINTHFGLGRGERRRQAEALLGSDWLGGIPENEPVVLCGDFNSSLRSKMYRSTVKRLTDVWRTPGIGSPRPGFPSMRPLVRLDHIFVSAQFTVNAVEVLQTWNAAVASDHLPLCAELTLPQAPDHADT